MNHSSPTAVPVAITAPGGTPIRTLEITPLTWTREAGGYWSACRRYFVTSTVSTAAGPWLVHHDPAGENAGFGRLVFPHNQTMREAKLKAAVHAAGERIGEYESALQVPSLKHVAITTFGYGHELPPPAHITLDLRTHFRDPHLTPHLRYLTAEHADVRAAVAATPGIAELVEATAATVLAYQSGPTAGLVTVAVGCAGGRHRAAAVGMQLRRALAAADIDATLIHRDLDKPVIDRPTTRQS